MLESNKLKKLLAKITKYTDKAYLKSLGNFFYIVMLNAEPVFLFKPNRRRFKSQLFHLRSDFEQDS